MFTRKLGNLLFFLAVFLICGLPSSAQTAEKVTCMLDWFPNPVHAPIYVAVAEGFFAAEGLDVDITVPADPNDPMKLVAAGKMQFALSYQPEVIIGRNADLPVISIGSLVQHPLSCIMFLKSSGIKTPADLKGKRIGYSVDPLYPVLFRALAEKAGLKSEDYELIHVGFNLVPPLLSGQVDAVVGAFKNYEVIQVQLEGKEVGTLNLEENGIPDYYELVAIAHPDEIKKNPKRVQAFVRGLSRGLARVQEHPEEALEAFFKVQPDLRNELNRKSFNITLPFFKGSPRQEPARWMEMQQFMLARGLINKRTPIEDLVWLDKQ